MRRYLAAEGVDEIATFSKRDFFREAAARGLIDDPTLWFGYQTSRNETSHTYNTGEAREVHASAVKFAGDAGVLLERLEGRVGA